MTPSSTRLLQAVAIAAGVAAAPLAFAPSAWAFQDDELHSVGGKHGARMSESGRGVANQGEFRRDRSRSVARMGADFRGGERFKGERIRGDRFAAGDRFRGERFRNGVRYSSNIRGGYYGVRRVGGADFRSVGYNNSYYDGYYGGYGRNFVGTAPGIDVGYTTADWDWNHPANARTYVGYSGTDLGWSRPAYSTSYIGYSGCPSVYTTP